jgi:hypothetical protein
MATGEAEGRIDNWELELVKQNDEEREPTK